MSFLDELDGGAEGIAAPHRFVEWWWRDEWMDLDAHRDVSEVRAAAASVVVLARPARETVGPPRSRSVASGGLANLANTDARERGVAGSTGESSAPRAPRRDATRRN